ncbi:MAG TPA: D-aminoacylase [Tepidisphaeraceae bacterium]|jgi:N-acyl-D-amino-acid deacylase|nr:D-aminoacylase [Tepidisphaeraceae bacterium]
MKCHILLAAVVGLVLGGAARGAEYDLIVRHGKIIDGTGNAWFYGDVGVNVGKIAAIGDLKDSTSKEVIDATGMIVAPGFIDVHTHADTDLYTQPTADNFIRDGVTSIITGNCGYGPLHVGEYFDHLRKHGTAVNVGCLIGHNTVLRAVKGDRAGDLTDEQMAKAKGLIQAAMEEGAVGFSTGLIYRPGTYSKTEEIIELAKVSAERGGIYTSHMRSESMEIMAAIDEALRVGREAGCRVEISHFKLSADAAKKIGGSDTTLGKVMAARAAGEEVWLDQYPYTASSTSISTMLPDDFLAVGEKEAIKKIAADPKIEDVIVEQMRQQYEVQRGRKHLGYVVIASCEKHPEYNGRNLIEVAQMMKLAKAGKQPELLGDGAEKLPEVNVADQCRAAVEIWRDGGASCVFHSMLEPDVANIMRNPLVSIASDSGVRQFGVGVPHPRGYGTNTRVLGVYVREQHVITLEEAIRKMTSQPALAFRLKDRGSIRVGNWADMTVFDAATVKDMATFEKPHQYPVGIEEVLVNGRVEFAKGEMTKVLAGVPLLGPGYKNQSASAAVDQK